MTVEVRPPVPHYYEPPHVTSAELEWADLPTIDLSGAGTESGREVLAKKLAIAMEEYGFFYVVDHGLKPEETRRIFDIADVPFSAVATEEKTKYVANIQEDGTYQGYKLRQYWHIEGGVSDQTEVYSVNCDTTRRQHPDAIEQFLPEISAFAKFNHVHILCTLLRLFARMLELPEETFVRLHDFTAIGESSVRFLKYFPRTEEEERKTHQVWLKGHIDIGSVTILWSQPISALQVLGRDKIWRWVKHVPNALIVNAGDALNFLTGGRIQGTIHRVVQPPQDQRGIARLGVAYFAMPNDDVALTSLVPGDGSTEGDLLTMREWRKSRTRTYGRTKLQHNETTNVEEEFIDGVVVRHYN